VYAGMTGAYMNELDCHESHMKEDCYTSRFPPNKLVHDFFSQYEVWTCTIYLNKGGVVDCQSDNGDETCHFRNDMMDEHDFLTT